jgi:small subunit ribosomal protein S20
MANIKSAKKDIRKTARRTAQNQILYTSLDKALKGLKSKNKNSLSKVYSILDKMVAKGVIKKNAAARKKSRISKKD